MFEEQHVLMQQMLLPTCSSWCQEETKSHTFPVSTYSAGRSRSSSLESAQGAGWILKVTRHMSARCSVHTYIHDNLLSEYTFQITKRKKKRNEKETKKRMHCVARVSIKIKAIFRAHRSFTYCN